MDVCDMNRPVLKLSDVKCSAPIDNFEYSMCPCGLPEDCLCSLRNVRRILDLNVCARCLCEECICLNESECYRECRVLNDSGGVVCICEEMCTCDVQTECQLTATGCICVPECTCGWNEYCNMNRASKVYYERCSCQPDCPCARKEDCYRIPFVLKLYDRTGYCACGSACICEDWDACYFKQVRDPNKQYCVCGSGLFFTDCPCYNKEYCFEDKWPPCTCGENCECPDRKTCFLESRKKKCKYCDRTCVCGYKDFCDKIQLKKERCCCGLLTYCKCFDQDKCMYSDKLVRLPILFTDEIGWRVKPVSRILPLKYEKYYPDGSFKTPYHTSVMIKFLNSQKEVVYKHPFQITANINELRRDLSIIFKIPLHSVVLKSRGQELHQTLIIAELGYKPYDVVELYLNTAEILKPIPDYYAMVIPDIITVRIKLEEFRHKDLVVEIYDKRIKKPDLGGYRDKRTGIEYRHAFTQTGLRASKIPHEMQNNRDTQTYWWRNRLQETKYSRGTQMTNENVWVANIGDKIISPSGRYEDAAAWERRRDVLGKVRTIQRYFRAWKMRQALHRLHEEYWTRVRNAELNARDQNELYKRMQREEVIRKIYPRSRADYSMLYGLLEKWKKKETERISHMHTKAARIAELYILLDREVKILSIIEKHRREVREDMKNQQEIDFFEEISAPLRWHSYNHVLVEMHTEKTQRGQRYKELYFAFCRRDLPMDQRLTLLLSLKYALKDHKCRLAYELTDLLDQECELLVRGVSAKHLDMLRKRQQLLLLEHVKTQQCNDCLTKRYRGLREIHMDTDLYLCRRCNKMKFYHEFPIHSSIDKFKICTICTFADMTTKPNIDIMPYRYMLEWILYSEHQMKTESCVMYMINERDIQYLVDRIWHGHSLLTETTNLYDLRLERWIKSKAWAPWNCVLLAKAAAQQHRRVEDNVLDIYGEHVCNDVINKNLLGRKKFTQMYYVNEFFVATGEMKDYRETVQYTPVPSEIFCNELCTEPDRDAPCVSEKCLTSNDPKNNVRKRIIFD